LCFRKHLPLRSEKLFSGSESEVVQSLSEFRVFVQRINEKNIGRKQLYRFLPQTGSSHVPLALPRRVPLKCNVKLQVAQSHKKETSQCSRTTPRDFSMLKDNSKRLLCSITPERDFYAQGQLQETSFAQSHLKETSIAQSQLKETYLNNYKELNKVLNT